MTNWCEATRLRSRLVQVAYVTSLCCLCPKAATFKIFGCKYVCISPFLPAKPPLQQTNSGRIHDQPRLPVPEASLI